MDFKPYLLMVVILLVTGCREKQHPRQTDHNISNIHMNKNPFGKLVNAFEDPDRASWQKPDEVIALLGDIQDKKIMDIGAGTGYFSFRMADKGARVIAADVDERFLEYIEEKKKQTGTTPLVTRKVPYDDPELKEQEADAVIIVNTYHHIEDRVPYFRKVRNGLVPDGKLMVVDYKKEETPHGPPLEHRMKADEVIKELEAAGFTISVCNITLLEYQYIIMAKKSEE